MNSEYQTPHLDPHISLASFLWDRDRQQNAASGQELHFSIKMWIKYHQITLKTEMDRSNW